jgi:hypothetical protein
MAFLGGNWQRVALAGLLVIPLILLLVLMTPAWLAWPFLSADQRNDVLKLIRMLVDWIKVAAGTAPPPQSD